MKKPIGSRLVGIGVAGTLVFAGIGLLADLTAVEEWSARFLAPLMISDAPALKGIDRPVLLAPWVPYAAILLICVIAFLVIVLVMVLKAGASEAGGELSASTGHQNDGWRAEFANYTDEMHRYVNNQYLDRPNYDIVKFHVSATIFEGGTVDWRKELTIAAGKEDCMFLLIEEASDPSAEPCEFASEIDLKVMSVEDGTEVMLFPTINEPYKKEFAVFLIPPLRAGQSRNFVITHRWTGYMADLLKVGRSRFYWNVRRRNPADLCDIEINIRFVKSLCPVRAMMVGANPAGGTLLNSTNAFSNDTWNYINKNAPLVQPGYVLEFSKT